MQFYPILAFSIGFLVTACPPNVPPPNTTPVKVDGMVNDCPAWCRKLSELDCVEGKLSQCEATCIQVIRTSETALHVSCVLAAATKSVLQACDPDGQLCRMAH